MNTVNRLLAHAHLYHWSDRSKAILARKQMIQRKWQLSRSILKLAATQRAMGWE